MIEELTSERHANPGRQEGRRILDTAVGILVGWRRCSTHTAYRELITASERHEIPVFAMASALVTLASRDPDTRSAGTAAQLAAEREWALNYLL
jgi:hypothetical protein